MISSEREAEILRLFHAEKWPIGTIAAQLGHHHSTVRRVLGQAGIAAGQSMARPSIVDDFIPFIRETLAKYPRLRASRLYAMARERGFRGSQDHFRHVVSRFRPKPTAEAYQRLRTLPGEQGQVDRGHFGKLTIDNAARPLWAFVMVLSFSRMLFLRFYFGSAMPAFLHGHVSAFAYFGGAGAREPTSSPTVARLLGRIRRSPSRECITATRRRRLSAWRGESTARGRRRS